uniref:Uncharacterized protein n=1 Tax=Arundo donax TaxID=35708 RepID=A0A0A9A668_ARUDO
MNLEKHTKGGAERKDTRAALLGRLGRKP